MNYKIKECEILICNKHYPALVEAIQNEYPHFPKNTESIIRIFEWFNFRIDVNFQGDIFGLELTDESREEDEALFNTMAPFVEPGSYIGFVNHAGDTWRCVFDGGRAVRIIPFILWPEVPIPKEEETFNVSFSIQDKISVSAESKEEAYYQALWYGEEAILRRIFTSLKKSGVAEFIEKMPDGSFKIEPTAEKKYEGGTTNEGLY